MRRKQRNPVDSAPTHGPRVVSTSSRSSPTTLRSAAPDPNLGAASAPASEGLGPKNPSPSRKLQQVFEQALQREAEERAAQLIVNSETEKVQHPNPKPRILINARGNPYEEGDPNMGYSLEDTKPRYGSHKPDSRTASNPFKPKKELSVSEDQLLEILGGVVSSNQAQGELKQHIKSLTSQSKGHSEPDYSLAPEPPDQLGSSSKEGADLVSKGSTGFNEYFSKSAKKRLKKQAKEESMEGNKSRPHAKNN
ncbi:hypothetical protein RHGRI_023981 [Rhododendron griersonianum]|uniref:Uncharacterized protein n=1 Tax=Rhododendron griersonianum TaxID=479676 RepID=A0AAV6JAW1_9ERIC|nr:hypothetical protein RHGRI_023981 [Rhododendron griersonianum]